MSPHNHLTFTLAHGLALCRELPSADAPSAAAVWLLLVPAGDGSSPRARGTLRMSFSRRYPVRFIPAGAGNTLQSLSGLSLHAVHPRGRGEHAEYTDPTPPAAGSSPRARGTPAHQAPQVHRRRFIPAGAGNTQLLPSPNKLKSVHPRGRGEHFEDAVNAYKSSGSSPRARGTRRTARRRLRGWRFIPAGAGNTCAPSSAVLPTTVHPRGRGEHGDRGYRPGPGPGSSPRARGTHKETNSFTQKERFIPAGAGNTSPPPGVHGPGTVHPRGRGEHVLLSSAMSFSDGSSPRARGTQKEARLRYTRSRFIPAGAGNTRPTAPRSTARSVHPRGRGEHAREGRQAVCVAGSSPRARGTRPWVVLQWFRRRFIPAGAGNTHLRCIAMPEATVHPRGRGEHNVRQLIGKHIHGSSPRARGTRRWAGGRPRHHRFIPAGAGNTTACTPASP